MRISRIQIDNFRSVRQLDLEVPEVLCLVGPNNAGKSNILQALHRVLGGGWLSVNSFEESDVYAHKTDSDISIKVSFEPAIPYRKLKDAPTVDVRTLSFDYTRYKVGADKGTRRFEQKCLGDDGESPTVWAGVPKKGVPPKFERLVNIPAEVRDGVPLIYIGTNRSLKDHLPGARFSMLRQLFTDIDKELSDPGQTVKVRKADGTEHDVQRLERFRQLMEHAVKLLRTKSFDDLETSIKQNALRQLGLDPILDADKLDLFFSPFSTMDFYKSLDLRVRECDYSVSATELGEGIQNALVLSILQAFEERRKKGAILLIEEPEMFLHPQMQRSLYKTIREIALTNQVIYTTHSPHFVSVPNYHEVALVRKESDGTAVRKSDLPTNDKFKEKLIKELDPERNELFFAKRLLLVEGDTEKLVLPEYAKQLGLDLDREGATIVEVGGKRNLPDFASIAISFGIPTGIVYDEDAGDFDNKREEEKEFNKALDGLARQDGTVQVWCFKKKYEDHLRAALTEPVYQKLCQKFAQTGKPTKARLIAMEPGLTIPEPVPAILRWLAGKSPAGHASTTTSTA
ncbi:MAG: AAA family ATPase [Flavobacteriales bacterium]|nr:AAA family ATPase [Flavobacteriales bacterium]